ncbi:hypothetical protein Lepto7375DRAFT_1408 [Leptolyngbya sp. PCC 7375]|nr:hypothetical protein Lepto7375DRAFT_1408 [Leptolyngbya sp. PCC 7375]
MSETQIAAVNVDALLKHLRPQQQGNKLYMLLDAAQDPSIYKALSSFDKTSYGSIFPTQIAQELTTVVPYLLLLDRRTNATKKLLEDCWGKSWGIFLESTNSLEELIKHMQTLLLVKDHDNRSLHFRYYDPRVLRVFLPTCNDAELATVLGSSVVRFWVESEDGKSLVEFPPKAGKSYPLQ